MLAKAEAQDYRFGSTERTKRLKANRVYPGVADEAVEYTKEQRTPGQVNYLTELKTKLRTFGEICPERARYWTQAYKESDGAPFVIRQALAVAKVLDNMTIYIDDDELIVGNYARTPTALPVYPEFFSTWLPETIAKEGYFKDRVTEEERVELGEISEYWLGKSYADRIRELSPPHLDTLLNFHGITLCMDVYEVHPAVTSGFEPLFENGANGMIKKCKARLDEILAAGPCAPGETVESYTKKVDNLRAMIIANESFARFGRRYAALARKMAKTEKDPDRLKDLEKIAEVCDQVPAEPARNFHEALQAFYFFHMIMAVISTRCFGSMVRFDTMFNPYYQKDKQDGAMTYEKAQELIECLFIKMESISAIRQPQAEAYTVGSSQFQTFTLGGTLEDGRTDATNEMSFLCLDAIMSVHVIQPTLNVRYHTGISPEFIDKCIDCLSTSLGFPAFFNDTLGKAMCMRQGANDTDVWNWCIPSCVSRAIPNKNMRQGNASMGMISYGKCLHLALNDGFDNWTGLQLGVHTGDPRNFKSIDDVKEAYIKQLECVMEGFTQLNHIAEHLSNEMLKRPLVSPYIDGCIEQGLTTTDFAAYGSYKNPEIQVAGAINVADSLTAIKFLVFDEKKLKMDELLAALETNWEGKKDVRQLCLNAPKFGNNIDVADKMAQWVHYESQGIIGKHKDIWGGRYRSNGGLMSANYALGRACQASADGRVDTEPFADGTCSPMAGRDNKGPTATLLSVACLDPLLANEMLLNQKFMPQFLKGDNKKIFSDYLTTWYDLGIWHIQFNVLDKKTLLDAQVHPENYQDLVVRVAGYSAYWVDLGKPVQDNIISRTEQSFSASAC
jgi:pyruvate formate-lyase/glycerol dehydratase family glycyl radical enzyme